MSPIKKMSYLQSRMHSDESTESNADFGLEDGEIRKLLTSSLCAQGASGRQDAMDIQESEVNALFSPRRNEERDQIRSSVFGNANVSNLSETLLEGNKDRLLNRARTDLARREIHVESLNKCINDLQKRTEAQDRALKRICRISSRTNLIARAFEIRRFEVARIGKDEESASTAS